MDLKNSDNNMFNNLNGKKLLMMSGMRTMCDYVDRAKQLGAYVIVADIDNNSPAKKIADESVYLDVTDVQKIVEFCKSNSVNGITTGFADILLEPYYEACKVLGFPCYLNSEIIKASTDKEYFKKICSKYNIPVAKDYIFDVVDFDKEKDKLEYPVFVKPLDASGSRGAAVCNNSHEFEKQYQEALLFSKSKKVVVEEYLMGTEFLMDYYVVDGKAYLISMFDRFMSEDRNSAINHSDLCIAPSKYLEQFKSNIHPQIVEMIKGLGMKNGVLFFQGFSTKDRITLYEMGCRLGGTFQAVDEVCIGINPMDMLVNFSLTGEMINKNNSELLDSGFKKIGGVLNIMAASLGKPIARIEGIEDVLNMKNVVHYIPRMFIGDSFLAGSKTDSPVVSFYFYADDFNEYKDIVNRIYSRVKVTDSDGNSLLMKACSTNDLYNYGC